WRKFATPVSVPYFTPEEGAAFLLLRAGIKKADAAERAAGRSLAHELGGLAIALEQAAAYMEAHSLSMAAYLRLFELHREKVLSRDVSPDYPHTVETVWKISFEAVRSTSPAAAELLALVSFFSPDEVPFTLVRAGVAMYPDALAAPVSDELQLREIARVLRRHSLIELQSDSLSVHRLVQAITRDALSQAEQCKYSEAAMSAVSAALPQDPTDPHVWSALSQIASHVSTVAEHCEIRDIAIENAAGALNHTGRYLNSRADYEAAMSYFLSAVRNAERVLGPYDPAVANCLGNLGQVYMKLGELELARTTLERALTIASAAWGEDHKDVAGHLNSLGMVSEKIGDYPSALTYYDRALRTVERVLGNEHRFTAYCLNNLGSVHQNLGNLAEAGRYYERALAIHTRELGARHPDVAVAMNNLGTLYVSLGDLLRARKYIEAAIEIEEGVFGPVHRNIARRLDNLAYVLEGQGDTAGAKKNLLRALSICRKIFGDDHGETHRFLERINEIGR
ncbi:MAG TPA: tetratricopeptide repeat protein, partial [Longimicrobium sp.]